MIAVIDDDASVRDATAGLLESLGYRVASFACAEEFLESGMLPRMRCLISDVRMSGMSGLELHARLVQDGTSAPTIFMTAFATEEVREQALGQGALDVLKKPFDEGTLLECLARAFLSRKTTPRAGGSAAD